MNNVQVSHTAESLASARTTPPILGFWPEWLTLLAFSAIVAFTIPHHEPWADEAQAWELARTVPLTQLFHTYLRYEGHTGLWNLLLSGMVHLGVGYTGMHWICGILALLGVAILVFYAPFPRYIRLVLPFTYFFAYQYAIVARSYVLVPLLLFAVAALWKRGPIVVALLLGLLGNVALHSLAISGGLALVYAIQLRRNGSLQLRGRLFFAALILVAFYGFAIWTVWPPHDLYVFRTEANEPLRWKLFIEVARGVMSLVVALIQPRFLAIPFWIVVALFFQRRGQLYYLLPIATFALFSTIYMSFWHAGLVVPALIAIFWIAFEDEQPHGTPSKRLTSSTAAVVAYVIAVQLAWTAYAVWYDYKYPYSPDLATAQFLAPRVKAGEKIAVTYIRARINRAFYPVGIQPYFSQNIFMNQREPFWLYTAEDRTEEAFPAALQSRPAVVVAQFEQYPPFGPYDPSRDPTGPKADLLKANGYVLTHAFCASPPFRLAPSAAQICYLIFEPK
jgi:hypothetical protein